MRRDFIPTVQRKVAISALPASALRGQGRSGLTAAYRQHLSTLDLEKVAFSDSARFKARLDRATLALRRAGVADEGPARRAGAAILFKR